MSKHIAENLEREGIKVASIQKRTYAFCIDELIISLLFIIIYSDRFGTFASYDDAVKFVSSLVLQVVVLRFIYQTFFIWYFGATIGKIVMKIVCIDIEYLDKPNISSSLIRAFVRNFSESAFYLGFLWAFGNEIKQTWHDKFSKLVVIDVA